MTHPLPPLKRGKDASPIINHKPELLNLKFEIINQSFSPSLVAGVGEPGRGYLSETFRWFREKMRAHA